MATCKICSKENRSLPDCWTNWLCPQCEAEEFYLTNSNYKPESCLSTLSDALVYCQSITNPDYPYLLDEDDLETVCLEVAENFGIPDEHLDAAVLEGCMAFRENRDITEAIRYWAETENII